MLVFRALALAVVLPHHQTQGESIRLKIVLTSLAVIIGCGWLPNQVTAHATGVMTPSADCHQLIGTWKRADSSARRGWETLTFGPGKLTSTTMSAVPAPQAFTGSYTCVAVPVNSEEIGYIVKSPYGEMNVEVGTGHNRPGGRITWYTGLRPGMSSEDEDLVKTNA